MVRVVGPTDPDGTLGDTTLERLAWSAKSAAWQPYRPPALDKLIEDYPEVTSRAPVKPRP